MKREGGERETKKTVSKCNLRSRNKREENKRGRRRKQEEVRENVGAQATKPGEEKARKRIRLGKSTGAPRAGREAGGLSGDVESIRSRLGSSVHGRHTFTCFLSRCASVCPSVKRGQHQVPHHARVRA